MGHRALGVQPKVFDCLDRVGSQPRTLRKAALGLAPGNGFLVSPGLGPSGRDGARGERFRHLLAWSSSPGRREEATGSGAAAAGEQASESELSWIERALARCPALGGSPAPARWRALPDAAASPPRRGEPAPTRPCPGAAARLHLDAIL